jgi:hypothetical protein
VNPKVEKAEGGIFTGSGSSFPHPYAKRRLESGAPGLSHPSMNGINNLRAILKLSKRKKAVST